MKGIPETTVSFDMRGPGARLREAREAADIDTDGTETGARKGIPEATVSFDMQGPGARLREAREAADIDIDSIATSLLLDRKIVEALEEDAFDRLPAPTFVRGYLDSYARVLGVPAGPILDMYDSHAFTPPPLGPGISQTVQAHTSDLGVRIVTFAVVAALALLVGLWWHSQEGGGFDIGAGLFGDSSAPAADSSEGIDAGIAPAPAAGEASAESVTAVPGEPPEASRTHDPLVPMLAEGSTAGDIPAGEPVPSEPADTEPLSDPDPSAPRTSPAPSSEAAGGVTVAADPTAQLTAAGDGSLAAAGAPGTERTAAADIPGADIEAAGGVIVAADPTAQIASADDASLASTAPAITEQAAGDEESDAIATQVAPGDDSGPTGDAAADPDSGRADRLATTADAAEIATPIETGSAPGETSVPPAAPESAGTEPDSAAARFGLVLEFAHESWVEVYDAERTRLFFGLVPPGRVLDFDGAQPFDVLLGFGKDVRVTIDGEAFDITPHIKHGVARFRVGGAPSHDSGTGATESGTASRAAPAPNLAESEP